VQKRHSRADNLEHHIGHDCGAAITLDLGADLDLVSEDDLARFGHEFRKGHHRGRSLVDIQPTLLNGLASLDRIPGDDLVMTQELISNMLGVRREGVTEAASRLQRDGLIRYSRGHIRVLDRPGLERRACECYAVVRKEYARLLPEFGRALAPRG
jgi:hypothetical protein